MSEDVWERSVLAECSECIYRVWETMEDEVDKGGVNNGVV